MIVDITIPRPGESINEVTLANWLVGDGSYVEKDQEIAEIESDKATLPLIAPDSGKIEILIQTGNIAKVGDIACKIDTGQKTKAVQRTQKTIEKDLVNTAVSKGSPEKKEADADKPGLKTNTSIKITPLAQNLLKENNISVEDIINGLKRIGTKEVENFLSMNEQIQNPANSVNPLVRESTRLKMSPLRKKLSERLVAVKNETAMLTTFNEVDMSQVLLLRKKYQDQFIEKYGIKLGLMSFFTKAASLALKLFPNVNSIIEGDEIIQFSYSDIGIAVQTDKGLMVPVLRNVEALGLAEIEKQIADLASRARKFRISIEELSGGTFTITNGGIFGSMLSTPILNPPQAGILGMHNIIERPVAIDGKVEIRPIMYVALSYDHRLIDGRDSVGFLKTIKGMLENPASILTGGRSPEAALLDL